MPVKLRPAPAADVATAWERVHAADAEGGGGTAADVGLLVRHYLALLTERAPGRSVEVRIPPYGAVQAVSGGRHTRGTPRAIVETDPATWLSLVTGATSWSHAVGTGRIQASGERSDLSLYLPLGTDLPLGTA